MFSGSVPFVFILLAFLYRCGQFADDKRFLVSEDQNLQQLAAKYDQLNLQVQALISTTASLLHTRGSGASTYIRWGKTTCPANKTSLLYSGFVAGSNDGHIGGAANHLCLPANPDWDKYNDAIQVGAILYGAEYQFDGHIISKYFKNVHKNDDVPCAVCTSDRPRVLMIPGKNTCIGGWTKEYSGYLVAGEYSHPAPSEFVCLDGEPEAIPGGAADSNGKLFYLTEGRCGSLPCPPYVNGRELTCVVCTK